MYLISEALSSKQSSLFGLGLALAISVHTSPMRQVYGNRGKENSPPQLNYLIAGSNVVIRIVAYEWRKSILIRTQRAPVRSMWRCFGLGTPSALRLPGKMLRTMQSHKVGDTTGPRTSKGQPLSYKPRNGLISFIPQVYRIRCRQYSMQSTVLQGHIHLNAMQCYAALQILTFVHKQMDV